MKMFVANCTKQARDFTYRLPDKGSRMQRIEIGQQIQVAGDLSKPEVDSIIDHYSLYGMKSVEEARKSKGAFTGLCYSLDKPVAIENMQIVLQLNDQVLVQRGQQQRKEAAVATTAAIMSNGDQGLQALEATVVEVKKDGSEPEVQEGVRVDTTAPAKEEVLTGNAAKAKIKNK